MNSISELEQDIIELKDREIKSKKTLRNWKIKKIKIRKKLEDLSTKPSTVYIKVETKSRNHSRKLS